MTHEVSVLSEMLRVATTDAHKKLWGQYLTTALVARFMANLLAPSSLLHARILDPGAGTGVLGIALADRLFACGVAQVELVAVESEPLARAALGSALASAAQRFGNRFSYSICKDDFLGFAELKQNRPTTAAFDLVIANPPYFKMSPSERRGGDSPNIYTRFMEVASRLLKDDGQMCFIIPRSFASGLYFRRFRRDLHARMTLDRVHVFDSRRDAFKGDGVLQENIVVRYTKLRSSIPHVLISSSAGTSDMAHNTGLHVPPLQVYDPARRDAVLSLPTTQEDLQAMDVFAGWPCRLSDHDLAISTGPVVPFRNKTWLREHDNGGTNVPLLWMQHVREARVVFPRPGGFRKPQYISQDAPPKLLVANANYILMRRFSAKEEAKRLTASVYLRGQCPGPCLGLENHLNFIHRPGGEMSANETRGLAALLNSDLFDRYFRISNGSTQVNASELRAMPLPPLHAIDRIGALLGKGTKRHVSQVLKEVLGVEA